MNSDRFSDPNPPVAGEAERLAVRQRARRIRRHQRLRVILPLAVVAAAIVAVAIPLAGLHSTPGPVNPAGESTTTSPATTCAGLGGRTLAAGQGVRFEYPSCWRAAVYDEVTSFSRSIVDLSNETMHAPCTSRTSASGTTTVCRSPLTSLAPDGVLVRWSSDGFPRWTLDTQPGSSLTVGGRPAREQISGSGTLSATMCGPIGADEMISVVVARPSAADNFYSMIACLRGPDTTEAASEVQAMLASTTFADQ